jgi:PAS domain-containing protein
MTWYVSNVALLCFFTTLVSLAVAMDAFRRQQVAGSLYFGLLLLAAAEWSFTSGLEFSVLEQPAKVLWSKSQYFGITSLPVFWLMFALEYTQQAKWLKRPFSTLLWIPPLITLVVVWTNELHGWLWAQITPASPAPGAYLVYGHGWWFWVFAVYGYLLMLVGTLALVWAILRHRQLYRRQTAVMLTSAAIPWIGNAIYLGGLSPVPGLDLTPISFAISGVLYAWGVFRFHLFELVPVAREAIVETMADGVLVLDRGYRVLDINPAAQAMLGVAEEVIGRHAANAFASFPDLTACCCAEPNSSYLPVHHPGAQPGCHHLAAAKRPRADFGPPGGAARRD